jgi:hypothetical protein
MPLFGKRQVDARVTGLAWSRVVQLERQEWVIKRASRTPSDGVRNVQKQTVYYLATVADTHPGPTDATRLEPRLRTYYTYEQLEWRKGAELKASGTGQDGVAWPAYEIGPGERVRNKQETYTATFTAGDKSYEATLTEQEWRTLESGVSCRLTRGLFGGVKKVTPTAG